MSQFGRTFATAASSFASKRSYAQNIRLPTGAIAAPVAVGSCSTPASPSSALFSLYGGNARAPSQSQVPFAGNPPLPAGISPASQPQMNFWTTSPPRSPSQLHFRINQQAQLPPSPSQMQFNMNNMFTPAAQPQAFFDLNVAFAETEAASQALCGSPASSSRSMSPIAVDNTRVLSAFQPSSTPVVSRKIKREDSKDAKKGLNPFTYYRKTFPARYPYIDAMIPTQMERSRLTGAFWQHESAQVRSQCAQAVYVDRTPAQIERLENIRLQTQEKRRQERVKAGTDKLTGRNALIFGLWRNGVSPAEFAATVDAHDRDYPLPEPARKRRRKIAAPKLDANLLLAAESLSIASSSPQPSVSSLAYSPAATFNPELPSAVLEKQDGWNPLAIMAHGSYEYVPVQHDAVSMEYAEPLSLTLAREPSPTDASAILCTEDVQSQFHAATLYDGLVTDFSSPPYALGSEGNLDAILDAYSFPVPQHPQDRLPTDMDYDFSFAETLPTEEDGLAFDVAYFGSASGSALDA